MPQRQTVTDRFNMVMLEIETIAQANAQAPTYVEISRMPFTREYSVVVLFGSLRSRFFLAPSGKQARLIAATLALSYGATIGALRKEDPQQTYPYTLPTASVATCGISGKTWSTIP